jgi:transposase
MKGEKVELSQRQVQRFQVMSLVEAGKMLLKEAAEKIGLSYRQAKRIRKRVKEHGVKGLIHGNRGKRSSRRLEKRVKAKVLELSRKVYPAFNDQHFTEKLAEREGIELSREAVRKIRREAGIGPKRKRRGKKHRKRRERKAQEGLMVLWDGSPHAWFGADFPPCCLMAALDDATGAVLAARFFPFEGSWGYLWLLDQLVREYGIPVSIYQDRHGSLHRNDDHWTLEEQLAGRQELTQVGQAVAALGIQPIFALSPEAKGRIERLFGTLQDRLVAELGLAGIQGLEDANAFLESTFIRAYNRRFAVMPKDSEKAWRLVPAGFDLRRVISFRYSAKVGLDNTARLGGMVMDIPPGPKGRSYARAKVEVRQLLDGSWRIYHQNQLIARHPSTALKEPIRALRRKPESRGGPLSPSYVYSASAPPTQNERITPGST